MKDDGASRQRNTHNFCPPRFPAEALLFDSGGLILTAKAAFGLLPCWKHLNTWRILKEFSSPGSPAGLRKTE